MPLPRPPPPSLQHSPSQLKSLHLLRALLREATYLPDANARSYFRRFIVDRFKAYQPTHNALQPYKSRGPKRRHISIINERTSATQQAARKGLNTLRRANLGDPNPLWKVLQFTYGRSGKRRYALLNDILKPEPIHSSENELAPTPTKAPLQEKYHSDRRWLQFFDAPKEIKDTQYSIEVSNRYPRLKATLISQVDNNIAIGRNIKGHRLITQIRNAWERPMPIRRARNDVRRWYAVTMARLLPPLPDAEWDRVNGFATGAIKWKEAVPRRTAVGEIQQSDEARSSALINEGLWLDKPSKADRPGGKQRPHNLTSRMMRRLYAKVCALSCKLEYDELRKKYIARWGSLTEINPHKLSTPVEPSLFTGVDDKGLLPNSTQSRGRSRRSRWK